MDIYMYIYIYRYIQYISWLVVYLPLWKMMEWKSGMITFPMFQTTNQEVFRRMWRHVADSSALSASTQLSRNILAHQCPMSEVSNPGRCGRLLGQDHGPIAETQKNGVFPENAGGIQSFSCKSQVFERFCGNFLVPYDFMGWLRKKPPDFRGLSQSQFRMVKSSSGGFSPQKNDEHFWGIKTIGRDSDFFYIWNHMGPPIQQYINYDMRLMIFVFD